MVIKAVLDVSNLGGLSDEEELERDEVVNDGFNDDMGLEKLTLEEESASPYNPALSLFFVSDDQIFPQDGFVVYSQNEEVKQNNDVGNSEIKDFIKLDPT